MNYTPQCGVGLQFFHNTMVSPKWIIIIKQRFIVLFYCYDFPPTNDLFCCLLWDYASYRVYRVAWFSFMRYVGRGGDGVTPVRVSVSPLACLQSEKGGCTQKKERNTEPGLVCKETNDKCSFEQRIKAIPSQWGPQRGLCMQASGAPTQHSLMQVAAHAP